MSEKDPGRLALIRDRFEALKNSKQPKKEETAMGGGKRTYLNDRDRELLGEIIKNAFGGPEYSDDAIVKKVNDGDLLNGAEINVMHVKRMRADLGLKMSKGKKKVDGRKFSGFRKRSKKWRETEEETRQPESACILRSIRQPLRHLQQMVVILRWLICLSGSREQPKRSKALSTTSKSTRSRKGKG